MTSPTDAGWRDRHDTWFDRILAAVGILGLPVTILGFIVMSTAADICFPWMTYGTVLISAMVAAAKLKRANLSPLWGLPIALGVGTAVAVATYWAAFLF